MQSLQGIMADSAESCEIESIPCSSKDKTGKRKYFRWETEMVENLIDRLLQYKSAMAYKGLDFDVDRAVQYKELRLSMAKIYDDPSLFGPVVVSSLPDDFNKLSKAEQKVEKERLKEEKDLISRGVNRVHEKVKEIRQKFSKAVVSGSRSGSGKVVYEFYDKLISLWGGSVGTEPLAFGVKGDDFKDNGEDNRCPVPEGEHSSSTTSTSSNSEVPSTPFTISDSEQGQEEGKDGAGETELATRNTKRKASPSCIPQLIDNKRKHLEKNLSQSAAQRDQLLFTEAKEDAQFCKDLAQAMPESTETFSQSIMDVSRAMTELGAGVCRSIEMLSHAFQQPYVPPPVNNNMFYQHSVPVPPHSASGIAQYSHTQMSNQPNNQQDSGRNDNMYYY